MIAAEEAVALKAFFASRGIMASDRSVTRALRDQGLRFREADVRAALSGTRPAGNRDATGTHESLTRDATGTRPAENRDATTCERADRKGVSKLVPYVQGERKGTSSPEVTNVTSSLAPLPPPEQPVLALVEPPAPPSKPDRRSPAEQVADDALALLRPTVSAELDKTRALTWTAWRGRNRPAAKELAAAGRSAPEIVALHAEVSGREGRVVLSLAHLQTAVLYGERETAEERRDRLAQQEWDRTRPPTYQELVAAGELPPLPPKPEPAKVVALRPPDPRTGQQVAEFAAQFGIRL